MKDKPETKNRNRRNIDMKTLSTFGSIALLIIASIGNSYGLERTPTGFYYPTGRAPKSEDVGWLASDASYFIGKCHIGHDLMANLNDSVYPISDGEIVGVSLKGWGDNNVGFLVKHKLATGIEFMALYGHIQANNLKATDKVYAEVPFGKIGYWSFGNHLHFGILPSLAYPLGTWGTMPSPGQSPYNGFVDPINWITTKIPKANAPVYYAFSSHAYTGIGDVQGGAGTDWNYSLPTRKTQFTVGETAKAIIRVENITVRHRWFVSQLANFLKGSIYYHFI